MATKTKPATQTSTGSKIKFEAEQVFDSKKMRHYMNGKVSVLHCHHYSTLFTQLAMDAEDFGGEECLVNSSADTFWPVLQEYYDKHNVTKINDRIAIAEQYYNFVGLGDVEFEFGDHEGFAGMKHSHVDEGWLKKWGQNDKPVNFIGQGYLKAAWAAIYNKKPQQVKVEETQSIVCGASTSRFNFNWK